jgi:hypothetical protein
MGEMGVHLVPFLKSKRRFRSKGSSKEREMQNADKRITVAISALVICLALSAGSSISLAQSQDPLIGTWNLSGSSNGQSPFISVEAFNQGGTAVEYDTSGTNSSASPGESIGLGKWQRTSNRNYKTSVENYIYDAKGNLSLIAIGSLKLTLDSTLKSFSGAGDVKFYNCSLSLCPGTLVASSPIQITGKRF